jgi:hypothetical protein
MQELKQVKLQDAIGKTIVCVKVTPDAHAIKYYDGTFSFFGKRQKWDLELQSDIILTYDNLINTLGISYDGKTYFTDTQEMLIDIGVLDGKKLIKDAKDRIAKVILENKERELKQYERLKSKFEKKIKL